MCLSDLAAECVAAAAAAAARPWTSWLLVSVGFSYFFLLFSCFLEASLELVLLFAAPVTRAIKNKDIRVVVANGET